MRGWGVRGPPLLLSKSSNSKGLGDFVFSGDAFEAAEVRSAGGWACPGRKNASCCGAWDGVVPKSVGAKLFAHAAGGPRPIRGSSAPRIRGQERSRGRDTRAPGARL